MRTIERTSTFKKDYKRVKATPRHKDIETLLEEILSALLLDRPLPERHSDHPLIGEWKDHRECHLKPDLLLIYIKPDGETLRLVRFGSHSGLF
ncbi:MAG: type II toxin-antitoxin system YafQ family toxin [Acidobacteriaceae bacterium]